MDRSIPISKLPKCHGSKAKYSPSCADCLVFKSAQTCVEYIEMDKLLCDPDYVPHRERYSRPTCSRDKVGNRNGVPEMAAPSLPEGFSASVTSKTFAPALSGLSFEYSFPTSSRDKYYNCSDVDLKRVLSKLTDQAFSRHFPVGYAAVRSELCSVHIELNRRQLIAPRFRPMARLSKTPLSNHELDMALDRQVIDIHWRAFSKNKPLASIDKYLDIFRADDFDFALAEKFPQEKWRPQVKVVHLHLSEEMQWEQAVLQNAAIRDKWRAIEFGDVRGDKIRQKGAPQIEILLREMMANTPHLGQYIPGLVNVWKARRIVGDSPSKISKFVSLMTGDKPRDKGSIRKSLLTLDRCATGSP
jgi:hypothetical protein